MERMTVDEFRKHYGDEPKKSKYHNQKTTVDGITFDSKAEANRYVELKELKEEGFIIGFARQPSLIIADDGTRYRPDFIVKGVGGEIWVEDVKGMITPEFKLKKTMWEEKYPWMELRVIR